MIVSDLLQLLLLGALWGGSFLCLRIASPVLGPIWLSELRVLIGGLALLAFVPRLNFIAEFRKNFVPLFVLGCINAGLPYLLYAYASLTLPAGFNSILNATAPLFATIVAFFWLQEKLTIPRAIGFALGFAGVVVLVGWKAPATTTSFILAVIAGLLGSLMYAIAGVYTKLKLAGVSPLTIATGNQLCAAILLLPAMPFAIPKAMPTTTVILMVLALALFSTALAYILYFRLIENVGATKALTVAYLIPLFAAIWGAIALDEPITQPMVVGCSLILLGTAIASQLSVTSKQ